MHVVFVWRRPPAPIFIGGAEISQRLLAEQLAREGHRVTYIGGHEHSRTGRSERQGLLARLAQIGITPHDEHDDLRYYWRGVSCVALPQRDIAPALTNVIATDPPDVVIGSQEGSGALLSLVPDHITTVGWLHSITDVGLDVLKARPHVALATSRFVATRCQPPPGTKIVTFYPPFTVPLSQPVTGSETRRALLMVNPVPDKGGELVHQLAATMPDRPFTLVEGWWPLSRPSLPNVTYLPSQWSMEHVYRDVRLLLVPSIIEEAFGRVVIEAGLHAVPALTSHVGGLPEAVGDAGMTLDPADVEAWRRAIATLDNPGTYIRYAHAATINAARYLRPFVREWTDAVVPS